MPRTLQAAIPHKVDRSAAPPPPEVVAAAEEPAVAAEVAAAGQHTPRPAPYYKEPLFPATPREFHSRPLTRGGCRNLQDSTFSLSGSRGSPEGAYCFHRFLGRPLGPRSWRGALHNAKPLLPPAYVVAGSYKVTQLHAACYFHSLFRQQPVANGASRASFALSELEQRIVHVLAEHWDAVA
ncbi:hypothetical protein HPB48_010283 [Haemaphysalis longicornis]|uniref:Uncharacterized protein n=1 Tax=Haemaphysalis longicornis TaxID=44386 RepID=A0A9J6FX43_HAELO|nr:hypothetical protein HPB48_010283 [Haemaphysalis longicornis]